MSLPRVVRRRSLDLDATYRLIQIAETDYDLEEGAYSESFGGYLCPGSRRPCFNPQPPRGELLHKQITVPSSFPLLGEAGKGSYRAMFFSYAEASCSF